MNTFQLTASIAERESLRYTPAGIPIVTARLLHGSQQQEAGITRQIDFEVTAVAAGEISGRMAKAELGEVLQFTGFLARKNRNSKTLVFHIIDIQQI